MSDRNIQSYPDYNGVSGQPVHSYQSIWMARWTQTTRNVQPQMHSSLHPCTIKELTGVEMASDIPRSANGFKEVESRTFGIVNNSVIMSLRNMRNENLGRHSVAIVDLESGSPKNDIGTSHMQGLRSQIDHEVRYRTNHIQPEGVFQNPVEHANSHVGFANSSFSPARPSEVDSIGSASHTVPRKFGLGASKFDTGRTAVTSFMRRQEEVAFKEHLSNTNIGNLEQEHHNYHGDSEKKIGNYLDYGKSVSPNASQNRITLLPNAPHLGNNSSGRFFPIQSSPPEITKSKNLHYEESMLKQKGHSVRDESLRTCTSLNSVDGLTEVPPRFSQTGRGFSVPVETNVNMCEENKILKQSRVSTPFEGNTSSGTRSFFPLYGCGKQGVKLHRLRIAADIEEEEEDSVQNVKVSGVANNEYSAETDTMDMDSLKENPVPGVKSSPYDKVIAMDLRFPAKEEVAGGRLIPELPDINIQLPALPDGAISVENLEPSTSRTQSLDMELMISPFNKPSNSKSIHCPHDPMESDPSSRWIKRLKLSSSNTKGFVGTTSSNLDEALTHKKVNKFFEIMKGSITSTSAMVPIELAKKDDNISLSHPWIMRWLHHDQPPTQQKKAEPVVVCEPQSSNLEDFQKKQFPSTAAMALMGRALSGFQKCELQKRESFVVWNTKGS